MAQQSYELTADDLRVAKDATYCDDFDTLHSPNGGHIVATAMKHGVHVCWQCGEPFDPNSHALEAVEKLNERGATVPVYVHRKCWAGRTKSFFDLARGVQVRRGLAAAAKKSASLVDAAREGAKKLIIG